MTDTRWRESVLADNPVLYLSRQKDGTTWRNEADTRHNASLLNGADLIDALLSRDADAVAAVFNGEDQHGEVDDYPAVNPTEAITVEAVFYNALELPSPDDREVLVAKDDQGGANRQFNLELSADSNEADALQFVLIDDTGSSFWGNSRTTGGKVRRGQRNHVMARWSKNEDGGHITLFVNGYELPKGTDGSSEIDLQTTNLDVWLGAREAAGGERHLQGELAEVAIYDHYLSYDRYLEREKLWRMGNFGAKIAEQDTPNGERYSVNTNHRGLYHDGERYWLFTSIESRIRAWSGPSLAHLTDHGEIISEDVRWDGLSASIEFGRLGDFHYAWLFYNPDGNQGIQARRYALTGSGPVEDADGFETTGDGGNGHFFAQRELDASGDVDRIFVMRHRRTGGSPGQESEMIMRVWQPDLQSSEDGGQWTVEYSPSTGIYAPLNDGYIAVLNDLGPDTDGDPDTGILEITMPSIGGAQSETFVAGSDNQSYGSTELPQTHSSVMSILQRNDGSHEIWLVYQGDEDADDNGYGLVNLWRRGGDVADGWTHVSSDLFEGTHVWHIAMTQSEDGSKLHFVYAPSEGAQHDRGKTIYRRTYDIASGELGPAIAVNRVYGRIDTIMLGRETYQGRLPMVWASNDGSVHGGTGSGGFSEIFGNAVSAKTDAAIDLWADSGLGLYAELRQGTADPQYVPLQELAGTGYYFADAAAVADRGVPAGTWSVAARQGDADTPADDDPVVAQLDEPLHWNGIAKLLTPVEVHDWRGEPVAELSPDGNVPGDMQSWRETQVPTLTAGTFVPASLDNIGMGNVDAFFTDYGDGVLNADLAGLTDDALAQIVQGNTYDLGPTRIEAAGDGTNWLRWYPIGSDPDNDDPAPEPVFSLRYNSQGETLEVQFNA